MEVVFLDAQFMVDSYTRIPNMFSKVDQISQSLLLNSDCDDENDMYVHTFDLQQISNQLQWKKKELSNNLCENHKKYKKK